MRRFFACLLVLAMLLPGFPVKAAEPVTAKITSMVLRPGCAGVYYRCALSGDTSQVAAWGVAMSTQQMPDRDNLETHCLYTRITGADTGNGALLSGVLKQENTAEANRERAEMTVYGRPYVEMKDGQLLFGDGVGYTFCQLLGLIDEQVSALSAVQKDGVSAMYEDYLGVTYRWGLPNLHATYADGLALNSYDASVLDTSIRVLEDASYSGLDLVNRMYYHAYTYQFINANVPADAPARLADGTADDTLKRMVVTCGALTESKLMTGDILFADGKLYLYGAGSLRSLNGSGAPAVDTAAVLRGVTAYTLLRPAKAMTLLTRTDVTAERDSLNALQAALVATAKAFWLRGERLQYADTRFVKNGKTYDAEFRWQSTVNAPEDCTLTDWGYTNCAAFTYEVYYQALGYKLPDNMYTTYNQATYAASNGTEVYAYDRAKGSTQTDAQKAGVKEAFLDTLQPGDIICIRRENSSGHALLYIGNGEILHSSGNVYNYTGTYGVEAYEASVRRVKVVDYFFNPEMSPNGDVFTVATKLSVIRPLNIYTGGINENTQNRMAHMEGIVAEKLPSHVRAQTADLGEEITFTYAMHNTNDRAVTLEVTETVPGELEWVSGGVRSGNSLYWSVNIPAGGRASVSYTAKVKKDVAYGTEIQSTESYVGGVRVKCEPITVGKKLTQAETQALIEAYRRVRTEGTTLTGLELVNALYEEVVGRRPFDSTSFVTVTRGTEGCFEVYNSSASLYRLNADGDYAKLLVPGLYGGYRLWASEFANDRTRLARPQDLQVGDVLLGKTLSAETVWMYLGEELGFVNMGTLEADTATVAGRLERLLAYGYYYAIMRPMQALEN